MKERLRFRTFLVAGCLAASAVLGAGDPTAGGRSPLLEQSRVLAVEAGDREVLAAVEYNRRHLEAVSADQAMARPALEALADSGDAFTLDWLQGPHRGPVPTALEALAVRVAERISTRLATSPEVPGKAARAWMLRTAVADLTCTALEVPLKRFSQEWLKRHGTDPGVRHEIEALAAAGQRTRHPVDSGAIRARAGAHAARAIATPANAAPSRP